MKNRLLVTGIVLLAFGLANFFRYLPISYGPHLWNTPFPFGRLHDVFRHEGGGTHIAIGHMPLEEAAYDPYWLFWSVAFYAGIMVIGFVA